MQRFFEIAFLAAMTIGLATACSSKTEDCGNAVLDPGETCDIGLSSGPGACPTSCADDGDPCTADALENAGTCLAACPRSAITECVSDDACCPSGCDANSDGDCGSVCGNGSWEDDETCDTAIPAGEEGACPTACDDGDPCTADVLLHPDTCTAACDASPIGTCADDDGCCLAACNLGNDNDCQARCGDGYVDVDESCDTAIAAGRPGACPTACQSDDACQTSTLQAAGTCDAECVLADVTTCDAATRDDCCPDNCANDLGAANGDLDCVQCGNGTLDPGEACDIAIMAPAAGACPTTCDDDGNTCTNEVLTGAGTCQAACTHPDITTCSATADGCCPSAASCTPCDDADCTTTVCGDECVSGTETCDTSIVAGRPGACPASCDGGDPCQPATLVNAGTCTAECEPQAPIVSCTDDDACCPQDSFCSVLNDTDCDNPPAGTIFTTTTGGSASCGGPGATAFVPPAAPFSGNVSDASSEIGSLGAGCLYLGGGSAGTPGARIPDQARSRMAVAGMSGSTLTLVADAGTGSTDCTLGVRANKQCISGAPDPCDTDTDCPGVYAGRCAPVPQCFFGPPIPLPNPDTHFLSVCIVNVIQSDVSGTADLDTGAGDFSIPLASRLYLTGNFDAPCPTCVDSACVGGANDGGACTAVGEAQTSYDCPPAAGTYLATATANLSPLTSTATTLASGDGMLCPNQANAGAFHLPAGVSITEQGSPISGDLTDGLPHAVTLASTFCVPSAGAVANAASDLPGPGAVSILGTLQLER